MLAELTTSAGYYARYRPPYPDALIEFVVSRCALRPGDRVADLGCGAGRLTVPLAQRGLRIAAIDPWPEMLQAARCTAPATCRSNIRWILGAAEDLLAVIDRPVRAVTFANSFHCCKDRRHVMDLCDRLVEPGGAVAVLRSQWQNGPPEWFKTINCTAREFAKVTMDKHRQPAADASPSSDEEVLRQSSFRQIETGQSAVNYTRTLEEIVAFTYSMAIYPQASFGDHLESFETTVRERLLRICPDGVFSEPCILTAMVGRREAP